MILWVAAMTSAQAQDPFLGQGEVTVDGPEAEILAQAVETNARLFGAVSHLETRVFPLLDAVDSGAGAYIGGTFSQTWNVLRVPAACGTLIFPLKSGTSCILHADMFAASGGLAFGNQHLALFYSVGFNGVYAHTEQVFGMRPLTSFMVAGVSALQLYTAPVMTGPLEIGQGIDDVFGLSRLDYIAGARGGVGGISTHVGFYASDERTGLFTNLSEERTRAMLSAVVSEEAGGVPYFLLGVLDSPLLEDALDARGVRPTLFARKLDLLPPDYAVQTANQPEPVTPKSELKTGHFGSTSRFVDGRIAVAWEPEKMLHELVLSVHTPDYPGSIAAIVDEDFDPDEELGAKLSFGVVQSPGMPWYGIVSQPTPFVELRGAAWGGGFAELVLGYNSQEVLAQFPYARNSVFLRFDYHLLGFDP